MKRFLLLLSFLASFAANSFSQACSVTPAGIAVVPRADGALAIWTPTGSVLYEVQYRLAVDSAAWTSVFMQASGNIRDTASLQLSRLTACKTYAVRVRSRCGTPSTAATSDWRTTTFMTLGCAPACAAPRGLFATARDSSAVLGWAASTATGVTYVVQYRGDRDSVYRTINATTNSLTISRLSPCTVYYFRVKAVCSATASSDYSEIIRFKTSGCAAPCLTPSSLRAAADVLATSNKINVSWVGTSTLGYEIQSRVRDSAWSASTRITTLTYALTNTRTCTPYGFRVRTVCAQTGTTFLYSEWSTTATVVSNGCPVIARCEAPRRLSFVPANTTTLLRWDTIAGVANQTYIIEWIGARDSAWRSIASVRGSQYNLTGLTACQTYMFRVKTTCSATATSNWSEPVRFQTLGCTPLCSKPKNLRAFINDSVVVFSWDRADLSAYTLTVASVDGSFATRSIAVTGFNHTLSGLVRCKVYKATLVTNCTDGRVSEAATVEFTTFTRTCITNNTCSIGDIFLNSTNDSTVVEAGLNTTVLASAYELQYRKANDTAWTPTVRAVYPRFVLRGLARCSTYVVRVRAVCTTGVGEWKLKEFRSGAACFTNPNGGGTTEFLASGPIKNFAVSPNPGVDAINLTYKLEQDANIDIQLVNLQGQVIQTLRGGVQELGNYNQRMENLGDLNIGIYMLVVRANGKVLVTQKWQKQ